MSDQPNTLMVPMHLDALYLRTDRSVLEPMADFSRLPYSAADHDVNPGVSYLSEELLSQPFHDRGFQLKAGIHLHWALPDALHQGNGHGLLFSPAVDPEWLQILDSSELPESLRTTFADHDCPLSARAFVIPTDQPERWLIEDPDNSRRYNLRHASRWRLEEHAGGENYAIHADQRLNIYGSQVTFPAVPNRWLVTRRIDGKEMRQWVVDSDYLHPPNTMPDRPLVTYPHSDDTSPQPFRYLGRCTPLHQWLNERHQPATHLEKLTAIGYGEPNFAAFYPNCHSVFGFHDDEFADAPPHTLKNLTYEVAGWYSKPEQDCIRSPTFEDAFDGMLTRYGLNQPVAITSAWDTRKHFNDIRYETLEERHHWKVLQVHDQQPEIFPRRTACYARAVVNCKDFDFTDPGRRNEKEHEVRVAVGNTGTEALSAYLADQLSCDKWKKWQIEDQLEAVNLGTQMDEHHLDIGPKFREARQAKEFSAVAGVTHWAVVPTGTRRDPDGQPSSPPSLTTQIGNLLAQLNRLQAHYDRHQQKVASRRKQLFADWCKYMVRAYPSLGHEINTPPHLHEIQAYITERDVKPIEEHNRALDKQEQHIKKTLGELLQSVDALNKTNSKVADYEVKSSPGPRFWQPNEPVLLIAGESAQLTPRHGEDGQLDCTLTHLPEGPLEACLDELAASVKQESDQQDPKQQHCCEQPWHPFLLEWSVDVHPLLNESNLDAGTRAYQPSFINSNYEFPTGQVDLILQSPDPKAFSEHANHYTGRTILTPYASTQLRIQLESFLKQQLLPSYYKANEIPSDQRDGDAVELLTKVISWYETADSSYQDEVTTALVNAYKKIYEGKKDDHRFRVMTQSLGGFNEALLQHKQTLQLPIDDPLGFDHDRAFANSVRAGVGNMNRSAPQPNNAFMPIRAGLLKLGKLRLVDTFGRVQNLKFDPDKIITTEAMTVGKIPDLIHLRPRITQPARLNLRWLSATSDASGDHGEPESDNHPGTAPVCGWVLPNHLDQSLMIYANDGQPLGSMSSANGKTIWRGAPGEIRISPWQIPNKHLCRLVCHLMEQDIATFLSRLDDQLEYINPQWFAQHQALSVIMGRPLAVSRVRLGLELRGLPAINQHDSVFLQDMHKDVNAGREHDRFTAVQFPVRLGNFGQLNDGLAVYWREQQKDDGSFCLTSKAHYSDEATPIKLTLHDAPQTLTLLLDPRAVLHATTGILPTKAINIPHEQYADVLKRLNITFRTAPILSPRADLRLPLPEEPGHYWSWLENFDGNWQSSDTIGRPKLDAHWGETQEILEGWLKLSERNTE